MDLNVSYLPTVAFGVATVWLAFRWRRENLLRRRSATALRGARAEIRGILDNMGSGLLLLDRRGDIVRLNRAGARILGLDPVDVRGRSATCALRNGLTVFTACLTDVLEGGAPLTRHELVVSGGDRQVLTLGMTVTPLRGSGGESEGVLAIFRDITEVVRMREHMREVDRLAAVGEMAASIAHEIRNPLGSIRGSVELLNGELELEGYQRRLFDLVLKESRRVNTIIADFLGFARLRQPQPRELQLEPLLASVAFQIGLDVKSRRGEVAVTHQAEPGLKIHADEEQLTQLLLNLALNACEAMGQRGSLDIAAETDASGKTCRIRVADSGPGVPEQIQGELFKPFFTTKKGGTGLGLPMVARIAHSHAGVITVGDGRDGGAVFTLEIPVRPDLGDVEAGTLPAGRFEIVDAVPEMETVSTP